jgi:UPF0716 protein FxsA
MKFLLLLAVLLIALPIAEFTVLIEMGRQIGTFYTILLVFGGGVLGAILAKREGLRILQRIQDSVAAGIMPTEDLLDGAIVLAAGILLIAPGFISDVIGMMLLLPPIRYPVKLVLRKLVRRSIASRTFRIER